MKPILCAALVFAVLLSMFTVYADTTPIQPNNGTTITWKNVAPPLGPKFASGLRIGLWTGGWWRGPYAMTQKGKAWRYDEPGVVQITYTENRNNAGRNTLKIKCGVAIPVGVVVSMACLRTIRPTPRSRSSSASASRCLSDRIALDSRVITNVSPARQWSSAASSAGLVASFPDAPLST